MKKLVTDELMVLAKCIACGHKELIEKDQPIPKCPSCDIRLQPLSPMASLLTKKE